MPVEKSPGADVVGATINRTGTFRFRATRVGADTALAQVVRMVREAQGSKAPIQRIADQVAAVFVPTVVVLALLTMAVWWLWVGAGFTFESLRALGLPAPVAPFAAPARSACASSLAKQASEIAAPPAAMPAARNSRRRR